jgi:hypothetical protein
MMADSDHQRRRIGWWPLLIALLLIAYVLSSGAVMATGCWLREQTHWDGWYAALWP